MTDVMATQTTIGPELHYKAISGTSGYSIVEVSTGNVVAKNVGDIATVRTLSILLEINWRLHIIDKLQVELESLQATIHKPTL